VLINSKNLTFVVSRPYCFYAGNHNTVEKLIKGQNGFRGVAVFALNYSDWWKTNKILNAVMGWSSHRASN